MKRLVFILTFALIALMASACSLSAEDGEDDNEPIPTQQIGQPTTIANQPTLTPTNTAEPTATNQPTATTQSGNNSGSGSGSGCTVRTDWPVYSVVAGDTVSLIARRAGTTTDTVATANCLSDPSRISTGQNLRVPRLPSRITAFTTSASRVTEALLISRTERINVSWSVQNRAANSNLYFEQYRADGTVANIELPRDFDTVPSSGSGPVAPFYPGGGINEIRVRLRLVDLSSGRTLDSAEFTLPIARQGGGNYIVYNPADCFNAPFAANTGLEPGMRVRVTNRAANGLQLTNTIPPVTDPNAPSVIRTLAPGDTMLLVSVTCYRPVNDNTGATYRHWQVRNEDGSVSGYLQEYRGLPGAIEYMLTPDTTNPVPDPVIASFAVAPNPVTPSGTVTITWNTQNSSSVTVRTEVTEFTNQPSSGTLNVAASEIAANNLVTVTLIVKDLYNITQISETRTITVGGGGSGPSIASFTASPNPVGQTGDITLNWQISGTYSSAQITWLRYPPGGSSETLLDVPSASGTYTMDAFYPYGSLSRTFTLTVTAADNSTVTATTQTQLDCTYDYFVSDASVQDGTCPLTDAASVNSAYQSFENGFMLWDSENDQIIVLYDDGTMDTFDDDWDGEDINFPEDPPDGLIQPVRGFGKIWVENDDVRAALGWADGEEESFTMMRQRVDSLSGPGGTQQGAFYASLPDGRHIRYTAGDDATWTYID